MFRILALILALHTLSCYGQTTNEQPIGTWQDHLPYNNAISVTTAGDLMYCATSSAIFSYDKSDGMIDRLSLVNGLSDIGISKIKYNTFNNKLIIAYANGNLDVLENYIITNLAFIKKSNILSRKSINHIYIEGKLAYLSTGFGIVVLDTDKLEIVDTYFFGPLGAFLNTNSLTIDQSNIYAATDQGVYVANKNNLNLVDYNEWSLLSDLGPLKYTSIASFSNRIFVSSDSPTWSSDTIYYNDQGIWQKFLPGGYNINEINVAAENLFINFYNAVVEYDTLLTEIRQVTHHKQQFNISPQETTVDNEGYMLIAEESHGLLRVNDSWSGDLIITNGPTSINTYKMDIKETELWMVSGGMNPNDYSTSDIKENLVNYRQNNEWKSLGKTILKSNGQTAWDAVSIAINPSNKSEVFFGTWDHGLFEVNNGSISSIFTAQNSALDSTSFGSTKVGALAFDTDNNLWALGGFTTNQIAVKTPDDTWTSFPIPVSGISSSNVFTEIMITEDNNKWLMEPRENSIVVLNENGMLDGSNLEAIMLNASSNAIPGARLHCLTEDLDGEIWIGTDEGIAVFYNPQNVFNETIKAEKIYLQQEGQTQELLENEIVTTIKVDGANRKWIGTQSSGVFLMSSDGTEEVSHFTSENSPLFSNTIFDIEIDPKTGEVYFATEKGLLSYKGTATDADTKISNVFVYPNPVKPAYTGIIAIRGLMANTDVRITDISGNIVYQTTSLGGQAVWDGKDFNGNKVQTGVYMVFNGSPQGELKAAAKILFIH
jgi:ligand-binding sensor domain-containing protein